LAQARECLRKREFSAVELADAHLAAMERARAPQCFRAGNAGHRSLDGRKGRCAVCAPATRDRSKHSAWIKDLFATRGVRTTACSRILDDFTPTYESTVSGAALA